MAPAFRAGAADVELTEVGVVEHLAIGPERLFEDLATVRHEEQRRTLARLLGQPPVVQRGDHGLTRAGGRHDEVAMAVVDATFDVEQVQHGLLVREGTDLKAGQ